MNERDDRADDRDLDELEATVADEDAQIGLLSRWGGLEIRGRLGEGAFGEVYRAWDARLEREVALKLLKAEVAGPDDHVAHVLHEGRLLARVTHPNVVRVHGVELHNDRVGLWMEFVRGQSLHEIVEEQGTLSAREAALIGVNLCGAVAAVHRAGLIHRDIKAGNVYRETGGRIVLMDFGAGTIIDDAGSKSISGTPRYIAPEVWTGGMSGPHSDIYSLGVLLYHLVTGSYPIDATSTTELLERHRRREARLLRDERPDLPEVFVAAVEKALAWDPEDRFASAGQMEQALTAALAGQSFSPAMEPPPPAIRRIPWVLSLSIVTTVLAVATIGFVLWQQSVKGPAETIALPVQPESKPEQIEDPLATGNAVGSSSAALSALEQEDQASGAPSQSVQGSPYTVEASLLRTRRDGARARIDSGDSVIPGDRLSLEFRASRELYLYVIDQDDQGRAFVLFPLPELELANPLAAGVTHRVPGGRNGKTQEWIVNTAGGREHILLLASPERLLEFEAELSHLPRPVEGAIAMELPAETLSQLRGIGGLVQESETPAAESPASRLIDLAQRLAGTSEVAEGPWLRQVVLENREH